MKQILTKQIANANYYHLQDKLDRLHSLCAYLSVDPNTGDKTMENYISGLAGVMLIGFCITVLTLPV